MQYIIGMDAGGSKTKCVIADFKGKILSEFSGGPANLLQHDRQKSFQIFFELIEKCRAQFQVSSTDIKIILIGAAGAGRRNFAEELEKDFHLFLENKKAGINLIRIESDAGISLEGAFNGKPGAVLIAGTGSIIFGKDEAGKIHKAGGFGRLIGDEGSGYSIGRKALAAASKELDGRGMHTLISELIKEKLNVSSPDNLIVELHRDNFDIASIAPDVIRAAASGDETAKIILDEESDELVLLVSAIKKKINSDKFKLCFSGGLINNENFYSLMLKEKMAQRMHEIEIVEPAASPEAGAVLLAKQILSSNQQNLF